MKNFTLDEFKCKCCGQVKMDDSFLSMIDRARELSGVSFNILSGYRCDKHDAEVDGKGNHNQGKASDIKTESSQERFAILTGLILTGFTRIGIAKTFIHADNCSDKPQRVVWLY